LQFADKRIILSKANDSASEDGDYVAAENQKKQSKKVRFSEQSFQLICV
jgi:hypothetical protein